MKSVLTAAAGFFRRVMFDNGIRFAVFRSIAFFALAVLVVCNPFAAAYWFRVFLGVVCAGAILLVMCSFKSRRKALGVFFAVLVPAAVALYFGRGDAVSGIGVAVMCCCTGAALFAPGGHVDRYSKFMRMICSVAAFSVALIVVSRCGQLGVRYLDQLHSYALALGGCAFANVLMIRRENV